MNRATARSGFRFRRPLARAALKVARWRTTGEVPDSAILVGAPHTSNWDWMLTMLLAWDNKVNIHLLVKKSMFKGPLGPILRASGAVALDRSDPGATIRDLLAQAREATAKGEPFLLGIAAEGTRSKSDFWKPGFYRIAKQTGLPITLAFLDAPSRTVGWGPTFHPGGDVVADMDRLREFYAEVTGIHPENFTPPRLKEEERAAPGA